MGPFATRCAAVRARGCARWVTSRAALTEALAMLSSGRRLCGPTRGAARALACAVGLVACGPQPVGDAVEGGPPAADPARDPFEALRWRMVEEQIEARGVVDRRVLAALRAVPRHEFVAEAQRPAAYRDEPLPIGHGQTISQPYIVALMTELAATTPASRVLEIGTGSGYQAAVLAELAKEVYTIEILAPLATRAERTLRRLGYERVRVRHGDGYGGWPEVAPFDAILVTAAAPRVPETLLAQLREGGRLVIPVGDRDQELEVHTRTGARSEVWRVLPVRFVPMTGEVRDRGG
jgi:protein-L-isoaspartate(D-aspartate) O-methyltransferase